MNHILFKNPFSKTSHQTEISLLICHENLSPGFCLIRDTDLPITEYRINKIIVCVLILHGITYVLNALLLFESDCRQTTSGLLHYTLVVYIFWKLHEFLVIQIHELQ